MGPAGTEFALLELEGQDIHRCSPPLRGFEQGLFFNRRDVEMEADEIHQSRAAQATLLNQ